MKLKVVKAVFVHFCIHAVVVVEALNGLLPLEIEEKELAVLDFLPILSRRQNLAH